PLGQLCSIGGHAAVAEMFGVKVSGFWTWFLWRTIYLLKLPAWSKRVRVAFDWTWELLFGRDFAHQQAHPSERVTHAYSRPGDYVFGTAEQAGSFYIIERGEVEIVRDDAFGGTQRLAVLGRGDFFGEMALLEQRPHAASARARTALEVVVVGARVFEQVSGSL